MDLLGAEFEWLEQCLRQRLEQFAHSAGERPRFALIPPPPLAELRGEISRDGSPRYADLIRNLSPEERLILALALAPDVKPDLLDPLLAPSASLDRLFTEFGLHTTPDGWSVRPTRQTALFLVAGPSFAERRAAFAYFAPDNLLQTLGLLARPTPSSAASVLDVEIRASSKVLMAVMGPAAVPPPSARWSKLATDRSWSDLVLKPKTLEAIGIVSGQWTSQWRQMDWRLNRLASPGLRVLIHGPPGVGKTLTVALLGAQRGLPVYSISAAQIFADGAHETLDPLLASAVEDGAIVHLADADWLFEHPKAHQAHEVMRRIEERGAAVMFESQTAPSPEDRFQSRLHAVIGIAPPGPDDRLRLWQDMVERAAIGLETGVDLPAVARRYDLTGGEIRNALQWAVWRALQREPVTPHSRVAVADITAAINGVYDRRGKKPPSAR